jgi:hypothetical protein
MRRIVFGLILVAAIAVAGCAASPQPFAYHDDRDEKPGPGLFSGEEGGFVIYGESAEKNEAGSSKDE